MAENNYLMIIAVIAVVAMVAVFGITSMTGYAGKAIMQQGSDNDHLRDCLVWANMEYEQCMTKELGPDGDILPILVEECGKNLQKAIFLCNAQFGESNSDGYCATEAGELSLLCDADTPSECVKIDKCAWFVGNNQPVDCATNVDGCTPLPCCDGYHLDLLCVSVDPSAPSEHTCTPDEQLPVLR